MNSDIQEIERKALNLPINERGKLIHNLILSLDSEESNNQIKQEWIEESKKRIKDYREGKTQTVPYEEVMKKARDNLK